MLMSGPMISRLTVHPTSDKIQVEALVGPCKGNHLCLFVCLFLISLPAWPQVVNFQPFEHPFGSVLVRADPVGCQSTQGPMTFAQPFQPCFRAVRWQNPQFSRKQIRQWFPLPKQVMKLSSILLLEQHSSSVEQLECSQGRLYQMCCGFRDSTGKVRSAQQKYHDCQPQTGIRLLSQRCQQPGWWQCWRQPTAFSAGQKVHAECVQCADQFISRCFFSPRFTYHCSGSSRSSYPCAVTVLRRAFPAKCGPVRSYDSASWGP